MRKEYSWVRDRLHLWGHWRRKEIPGLGFPSITAEAKIKDSPGRSTKPNVGLDYWPPTDEVRQTDRIIMGLDESMGLALWCRYVQGVEAKRAAVVCNVTGADAYWCLVERAERLLCKAIRDE